MLSNESKQRMLPLSPQRGLKCKMTIFHEKSALVWKDISYNISLYDNHQR